MIHLVTGGARAGKSRFVVNEVADGPVCFVATAEALDAEMGERIVRHRAERPAEWSTIEAPVELPQAIVAAPPGAVIVDCLTMWVSNLLLRERPLPLDELVEALLAREGEAWVVTNEVGLGIVPDNPLARRYRDELGRCNQRVAAVADRVSLLVAGLPLRLR